MSEDSTTLKNGNEIIKNTTTLSGEEKNSTTLKGEGTSKDIRTLKGEGTSKNTRTLTGEGTSKDTRTLTGEGTSKDIRTLNGEGTSKDTRTLTGEGTSKDIRTLNGEGTSKDIRALNGEGTSKDIRKLNGEGTSKNTTTLNGERTSKDPTTLITNAELENAVTSPASLVAEIKEKVASEKDYENLIPLLAKEMVASEYTLLNLVEDLGEYLTDPDASRRRNGMHILSSILQNVPKPFLKESEVQFIVGFYCDKLMEQHTIIPTVLHGLSSLVFMDNCSDSCYAQIFASLNLHITCQSYTQAQRYNYFVILFKVTEKSTTELKLTYTDVVSCVLSAIDGESDPRNLLLIFKNFPKLLSRYPLGDMVEEAFDIISCYFPVDFKDSANDPQGVTRINLRDNLHVCLTGCPEFAPQTINLALEKLSSTLKSAKLDSLLLLKEAFEKFPVSSLLDSSIVFKHALVTEIQLPSSFDDEILEAAANAASSLVAAYSKLEDKGAMNGFLDEVFMGNRRYLIDIHSHFFEESIQLVIKIAASSIPAYTYLLPMILSNLISANTSTECKRIVILRSLGCAMRNCNILQINFPDNSEIMKYVENVKVIFMDSLKNENVEVRANAINALNEIIVYLDAKELETLYGLIFDNIRSNENSNIRLECANLLKTIANYYTEDVMELLKSRVNIESDSNKEQMLEALGILAGNRQFIPHWTEAIANLLTAKSDMPHSFCASCVRRFVESWSRDRSVLESLQRENKLINMLVDWWFEHFDADTDCPLDDIASELSTALSTLVSNLDGSEQIEILTTYIPKFVNSYGALRNLNFSALSAVPKSVIILEGLLCGARPSVLDDMERPTLSTVIYYLYVIALVSKSSQTLVAASTVLASIFNKIADDAFMDEMLNVVWCEVCLVVSERPGVKAIKQNGVTLFVYVTKGLILRNFRNFGLFLEKYIDFLNIESTGILAASLIENIFLSTTPYMNEQCHFRIDAQLYKENVYGMFGALLDRAISAPKCSKMFHILALVYLMKKIPPSSSVTSSMKQVLTLFALGLDCKDNEILVEEILMVFCRLAQTEKKCVEEMAHTFITKFLDLAKNSTRMVIRVKALECIYHYSNLSTSVILPLKPKVIQELTACVDDRKRLVRREAVRTRTNWYIVGQNLE